MRQALGVRGRAGKRAGVGRSGRAGERQAHGARGAGRHAGRGSRRGPAWSARGRASWARGLGARAGLGLCTRCTRPVFGPVQLSIFLSQIFFGHCS